MLVRMLLLKAYLIVQEAQSKLCKAEEMIIQMQKSLSYI